ncbi:MAG: hypothetical protein V4574_11820 [Pseudomonadota bacterium]
MTLLCTVVGHSAQTTHHHNQGLDFTLCHHCGCDLVRATDGDWTEVPKGFRVVWREFGRAGDAASVAARMGRIAPPPRRRDPRNARPKQRRDPRGRPLSGAASMFGALSGLGKLLSNGEPVEDNEGRAMETSGQYVICLPSAG